jgi:SAM-dependent methyltransferase
MFDNLKLAIDKRYSDLAESNCCLSCGGAINYSEPKAGDVCVDLGSGRGTDVIRLADIVGPQGFVYGIDMAESMIRKSIELATKLSKTNVKFIQSNLEELPLPDNSVNLIISNCTLNHVTNKQLVWNEIYRVLKPGGSFVISDIYATEKVPDEFHNDPVAIAECWAGAVTREEYLDQIKKAGFTSLEIFEESTPYPKGKIFVVSWTIKSKKLADFNDKI